jgi:hypothetical protein
MDENKLEIKPTIGSVLRIEREDQKRTIDDVSAFTRIRPQFLEAIERDDFDALPSGVYGRLYVKAFAEFLNIDVSHMLDDIYSEPIHHKPVVKKEERVSSFEPGSAVVWGSSLVVLLLVAVVVMKMSDSNKSAEIAVVEGVFVDTPEKQVLDVITTLKKEISIVAAQDVTLKLVDDKGEIVLEQYLKAGDTVFVPMKKDLVLVAESLESFEFYVDGHFVHSLGNLIAVDGGYALSVEKLAANIEMSSMQDNFDNENASDVKAAFDAMVAKRAGADQLGAISPEAGEENIDGAEKFNNLLEDTVDALETENIDNSNDTLIQGP